MRSSSGDLDGATGFFDLLTGGSAGIADHEGQRLFDFAIAEHLDLVATTVEKADLAEGCFVDDCAGFKVKVEVTNIDDAHFVAEVVVVESTLRKTTVKGHLATFETNAGAGSGTGLLTLVAFTGGFAATGAFAGAEALDAVFGSRIRAKIVKFHKKLNG